MKKILTKFLVLAVAIFLSVLFTAPAMIHADDHAPFFVGLAVYPYHSDGTASGPGYAVETMLRTSEWQKLSLIIPNDYFSGDTTKIKIDLELNNPPGDFESTTFNFDDVYFGLEDGITNLAPNPSFELGSGGNPDGWQVLSRGAVYIWDNTVSKSGSYSVGIKDITPEHSFDWRTSDFIAYNYGTVYKATVWVRVPPMEEKLKSSSAAPTGLVTAINETSIPGYDKTSSGFVNLLYTRLLSRNPEKEGLDAWLGRLTSGSLTGADLVNQFIFGKECQKTISGYTNNEFITFLYKALFNREPDSDGLNAWLARTSAGMTKEEVVNGFTHSLEFEMICKYFGIKP